MDTSGSDRAEATSPAVTEPTADPQPAPAVPPAEPPPAPDMPAAEPPPAPDMPAAEPPPAPDMPAVEPPPASEGPAGVEVSPPVELTPSADATDVETAPTADPPAADPPAATPATVFPASTSSAQAPSADPSAAGPPPADAVAGTGWIDAEGTVFVRTAGGDRAIGSWQAGSVAEGLAHYRRRYDDLVTEIELLEARLAGGMSDAAHTRTSAVRLQESLATAAVLGDLDALAPRLETLQERATQKADEQKAAKAQAREAATARKQELVAEAEQIATESTQWKASGDRLHDILTEWKSIRGVDRKADTELWRRYAAARDGFSRRRGSHFASLDAARKEVQSIKDQLVAEAEELAESTEWASTANRLKELMVDWKAAGRAPREAEEQLWKRFRAAQDTFFARRSSTFAERDAELHDNQAKKEELLVEAERIETGTDLRAAQAAMRDIQARWDDIGRVPRESVGELDRRLRAVEERVRVATDAEWRRNAVQSNPLLGQMREQVAKAERQLERAKTAGDARRVAEAERALASKRQFLALAEQAG